MAVVERTMRQRNIPPSLGGWMRSTLVSLLAYGLALLAIVLVGQQVLQAGQTLLDDARYGFPRRASITGYVGHGDERLSPTYIETLNLDGHISVLVIPGSDVHQLHVLTGPYIVGSDGPYYVAQPVLRDVNDDTHVDLLVTVRDEVIVYINESGTFRTMTTEERADLAPGWHGD